VNRYQIRKLCECLRHSWAFNAVVLPTCISLLCGLLVHLLMR